MDKRRSSNKMPNLKFATRWADDESEEMPEIPWIRKTPMFKKWGTLDRSELDCKKFLEPLDRASDFYLKNLWRHYVVESIVRSVENRLLAVELRPLDSATEIYLEHYWAEKVNEAKAA